MSKPIQIAPHSFSRWLFITQFQIIHLIQYFGWVHSWIDKEAYDSKYFGNYREEATKLRKQPQHIEHISLMLHHLAGEIEVWTKQNLISHHMEVLTICCYILISDSGIRFPCWIDLNIEILEVLSFMIYIHSIIISQYLIIQHEIIIVSIFRQWKLELRMKGILCTHWSIAEFLRIFEINDLFNVIHSEIETF